MGYKETVLDRIQLILDNHPYISIEFMENSFKVLMENRNPNILGNFAGGDMAYVANASAALLCLAEGHVSQTASINIECIARGEGELLVSNSEIVHNGSKLIRLRSNVYIRSEGIDSLVAIAQVNMSPMSNQNVIEEYRKK